MKLRVIVATAQTREEAIAIFDTIARTHAFIEFFKIDGCQVTVIYEPEQERFDRLNREAEEKEVALSAVKKPAKQLTIEDLEAKVKKLALDKELLIAVSAWSSDKPQEFTICDKISFTKPLIFKSKSAIAVSRKLTKISKERQTTAEADRALAVKAYESGACEKNRKAKSTTTIM